MAPVFDSVSSRKADRQQHIIPKAKETVLVEKIVTKKLLSQAMEARIQTMAIELNNAERFSDDHRHKVMRREASNLQKFLREVAASNPKCEFTFSRIEDQLESSNKKIFMKCSAKGEPNLGIKMEIRETHRPRIYGRSTIIPHITMYAVTEVVMERGRSFSGNFFNKSASVESLAREMKFAASEILNHPL